MRDDNRKVGVLNYFDLTKFADQAGASGQDNIGTLPYMALDFLSGKGLWGEIPRRYRHEARSFAASYLPLFHYRGEFGRRKSPQDPHPLRRWFGDWESSIDAKIVLRRHDHNTTGACLARPSMRAFLCSLRLPGGPVR